MIIIMKKMKGGLWALVLTLASPALFAQGTADVSGGRAEINSLEKLDGEVRRRGLTAGGDTYMELYDGDSGALLGEDDDSGSGGNARVRVNAPAGTVYVEVSEYEGRRGPYTLYIKTE